MGCFEIRNQKNGFAENSDFMLYLN